MHLFPEIWKALVLFATITVTQHCPGDSKQSLKKKIKVLKLKGTIVFSHIEHIQDNPKYYPDILLDGR